MKIHFIGICGVAMSAIAIAFQKKGWEVSGSDAGFFPPISMHLKKNKINFYPGWHQEKMTSGGSPDLVVVGNVASSSNPEWLYVLENKIPYLSYPEVLAKYFIKNNSIVCAGTYGKTSTSALLSFILTKAEFEPSYMFGALAINEIPAAELNDGKWSVIEGDEYKSARWDMRPKFAHYSPTHLLLSGLHWDHADVYPSEEKYFRVFEELVAKMPENGIIVANGDEESVQNILQFANSKILTYGMNDGNIYQIKNIKQNERGLTFYIQHGDEIYKIKSLLLGEFQVLNIAGCFALAHSIGIKEKIIIKSITEFAGIKRRMEKRFTGKITVFDDIAHSPAKANATLGTLRKIYNHNIVAVFEPNTGNRKIASAPSYANAFAHADEVIIPELTKIKQDPNDSDKPFNGQKLAEVIGKTHANVKFIPDDDKLVSHLICRTTKGDCVVFLGSHGFRGMIEELIKQI